MNRTVVDSVCVVKASMLLDLWLLALQMKPLTQSKDFQFPAAANLREPPLTPTAPSLETAPSLQRRSDGASALNGNRLAWRTAIEYFCIITIYTSGPLTANLLPC